VDDEELNHELNCYLGDDDTLPANCQSKSMYIPQQIQAKGHGASAPRVFRAYLEDWEIKSTHENHPKDHFRLLAKYKDLNYLYPATKKDKTHMYACTISNDTLIWINKPEKKDVKKDIVDAHFGWAAVLVPKGWKYEDSCCHEYEHFAINYKNNYFHDLIAIAEQQPNVVVLDRNNKPINQMEYFKEGWPGDKYPGDWDELPDGKMINNRE